MKGCQPSPEAVMRALHRAGIEVEPAIFDRTDMAPAQFLARYEGRPEFDESPFTIAEARRGP